MPTLLTKEAEKVKQNRVRTILAVLFLAVEKIALHKLPALAKLVFQMGFRTSYPGPTRPLTGYRGQQAAGRRRRPGGVTEGERGEER